MIIKSLELENFRNYENLNIEFDQGVNILYGDNAQGKTNILEAIYVLSTTKSHKGSKDKEIISFGKDEGHIRTLIERAMDMGFYEGVNLSLSYCDDCGHQELNMDVCPKCGSRNLTKIDRMNGYLSYSRVKGDTRLNEAKMEEIKDRVSM